MGFFFCFCVTYGFVVSDSLRIFQLFLVVVIRFSFIFCFLVWQSVSNAMSVFISFHSAPSFSCAKLLRWSLLLFGCLFYLFFYFKWMSFQSTLYIKITIKYDRMNKPNMFVVLFLALIGAGKAINKCFEIRFSILPFYLFQFIVF